MGTPESSATLVNESVESLDQEAKIDWEKRFKDTQAAYTKSRQEIAELKAKLTVSGVGNDIVLPDELRDELEELKYSDPDAWREKLSSLEQEHNTKYNETVKQLTELEQRQIVFHDFSMSHPDNLLTDEVVQNDVPPRITKKLEKGEITFEEFLKEAYEFLKTPKVIGDGNTAPGQPNLGKVGGGSLPSDSASAKIIAESYKNEIY